MAKEKIDFDKLDKKDILEIIKSMSDLPCPSESVKNIIELFRDENVNVYHIVEEIEKDQSLAAKVLKLINSGYYSLRNTVDSIERAVALLGILNVKQLVYSASVSDFFSADEESEWRHSYSCFVLMGNLIREEKLPVNSNLPLTMLMHDLGQIPLRRLDRKLYEKIPEICISNNVDICTAERMLFKVDHCDVGAFLMSEWEMSDSIIDPIQNHHTYDSPTETFPVETALLQFVDWVDTSARETLGGSLPSEEILESTGLDRLDVDFWIRYQKDLIELLDDEEFC